MLRSLTPLQHAFGSSSWALLAMISLLMLYTLGYVQTMFWTARPMLKTDIELFFLAVGPTLLPLFLCPESDSISPVEKSVFPQQNHPDTEQICPKASIHSTTHAAKLWLGFLGWSKKKKLHSMYKGFENHCKSVEGTNHHYSLYLEKTIANE